eukprot:5676428-Pleurochrysis_carterae.AAC.6
MNAWRSSARSIESAGNALGKFGANLDERNPPSSEMNSICRGLSELLYRHAPPRPRDGGKWALEVPLQGEPQPPPEPPPSQEVCDQRTRGHARAHAGPEPKPMSGRNRRVQGQLKATQQQVLFALRLLFPMLILQFEKQAGSFTQQNSMWLVTHKSPLWPKPEPMLGRSQHAQGQSGAAPQHVLHSYRLLLPPAKSLQLEAHAGSLTGPCTVLHEQQKLIRRAHFYA